MDNFMDKLALRYNAGEMIKANSQAEAAQMEGLQEQVEAYEAVLQEMRKLNYKNTELTEKMYSLVDESIEKVRTLQIEASENGANAEMISREMSDAVTGALNEALNNMDSTVAKTISESLATALAQPTEEIKQSAIATENVKAVLESVSSKFDSLDQKVDGMTSVMDGVNGKFDAVTTAVDSVNGKFDAVTTAVDSVSGKLDAVTTAVDGVNGRFDAVSTLADSVNGRFDELALMVDAVNDKFDGLSAGLSQIESGINAGFAQASSEASQETATAVPEINIDNSEILNSIATLSLAQEANGALLSSINARLEENSTRDNENSIDTTAFVAGVNDSLGATNTLINGVNDGVSQIADKLNAVHEAVAQGNVTSACI